MLDIKMILMWWGILLAFVACALVFCAFRKEQARKRLERELASLYVKMPDGSYLPRNWHNAGKKLNQDNYRGSYRGNDFS